MASRQENKGATQNRVLVGLPERLEAAKAELKRVELELERERLARSMMAEAVFEAVLGSLASPNKTYRDAAEAARQTILNFGSES